MKLLIPGIRQKDCAYLAMTICQVNPMDAEHHLSKQTKR